jgi:GT2 family glycosyltransferase
MIERTGVVIIGRNEGERLRRCLKSVLREGRRVVYVDSGSDDGSPAFARGVGAEVVELDMRRPFTAARARNAGLERLLELDPLTDFVQFVDGDCEIIDGWLDVAARRLVTDADCAAVCGRLRERHPEKSIYNRLCDLEWNTPVGERESCGGIAMYRVANLAAAGGFDPTIPAGEEPELCMRLRRLGKRIFRLDAEMALHDSAMLRFGQWWRRQVRGGYGALDVATRFESRQLGAFTRQVRSARLWTVGWAALLLLAAGVAGAWGWRAAAVAAGVVAFAQPLQACRIAFKARRKGVGLPVAPAHGVLTVFGKWAQLQGQLAYARDRALGRGARLIEHKAPPQTLPITPAAAVAETLK